FVGLQHLAEFVEGGGVLVTLGNSGVVAVDGGMVRRVGRLSGGFNTPGSELQAKVLRPLHPIAYGYPALPSIFRGNGPIWDVADLDRGFAVLQFGTKEVPAPDEEKESGAAAKNPAAANEIEVEDADAQPKAVAKKPEPKPAAAPKDKERRDLVLSGFVKGKDQVDGKPAILDVPMGKGRVILFAFNPLHRYLNHSDFRFVYNVILNWNDLPR
ncbi:MAG TPA: hypothetical protein VMM92_11935, partial [Thermoanaerobaculia bacterium]|nr:hypothetical protein [Thermoanaerobaculia bacterium]